MVRAFSFATASAGWRANWQDAATWSLSSTATPRPRPATTPRNTRPRPRSATRPARRTLSLSRVTRTKTPASGGIDATARHARAATRLWRLQRGLDLAACPGGPQRVLEQAGHRHGADTTGNRGQGTGDVNHLVEGHVADEAASAIGGRHALDANVDDGGAGLDPVPAHHFGPTDRCH